MDIVVGISALACAIGAGLGFYGLVDPGWAARLVRLRDDPDRPGGGAEFRATYGGLFIGVHVAALILLFSSNRTMALGALAVAAAGWIATAVGRAVSIVVDKPSNTGFNMASTAFELALGLMIAAPFLSLAF
jgi:hypothetical protein